MLTEKVTLGNLSRMPIGQRLLAYLPCPDVDHHVVLVTHADNVFTVGREGHTGYAILMFLQLRHLPKLTHLPHTHRRQVTRLGGGGSARTREGEIEGEKAGERDKVTARLHMPCQPQSTQSEAFHTLSKRSKRLLRECDCAQVRVQDMDD